MNVFTHRGRGLALVFGRGLALVFGRGLALVFGVALMFSQMVPAAAQDKPGASAVAIFAGGCFWCVESDFDSVPGVLDTISGYTGGRVKNPTYAQVTAGASGHREAVKITFDPKRVSYTTLVDIFWHSVDPTDGGGQFCDRGESYSSAIFATNAAQRQLANASKAKLIKSGVLKKRKVRTPVLKAGPFYAAEDYHQNYYKRSPLQYKFYRYSCGRDARLKALWGADALRGIDTH